MERASQVFVVVAGRTFAWDAAKAASNLKKHGVDFFKAATAVVDPLAALVETQDVDAEVREVVIGWSRVLRLLLVVHTERKDATRIISGRVATPAERRTYEQS